ncbi:MAG: hypothetical protein JSR56_02575 [Proteobacteria bacterium]|nr:hypothetical protein [Pseudomonadota bacterium]
MRVTSLYLSLPRHPLLRALAVLAGVLLLAGLVAAGLLLGAAVVAVTALVLLIRRWLPGSRQQRVDPTIIEGEFTVVPPRPRASLPHGE